MELILHIGSEKSATTTIQNTLLQLPEFNSNILYPEELRYSGQPHNYLVYEHCLKEKNPLLELDFDKIKEKYKKIVLSCEHFSFFEKQSTDALNFLIRCAKEKDIDVHLIYAARDSISFLHSLYIESLKWGEARVFSSFSDTILHRLDPDFLFNIAIENKCQLSVIKYSKSINFLKNFFSLLDIELPDWKINNPDSLNEKYSHAHSEVLYLINNIFSNVKLTREIIKIMNEFIPRESSEKKLLIDSIFDIDINTLEKVRCFERQVTTRNYLFHSNFSVINCSKDGIVSFVR